MTQKANLLINEKSPYLLQHAYNPVEWRAWNDEAFEIARRENKPIFLSIGYSTCHWCHVMEHESFENDQVAALMNAAFINIKVDREERPDVDNIYMTVCQMLTGHGGWPLTVIMTPDKKPFFAGTYIPRETQYGRIGMLDFIPRITEVWTNRRDEVDKSAEAISDALRKSAPDQSGVAPELSLLDLAYGQLRDRFDRDNGGFGDSPKFPTPHNLNFLLRYWHRTGEDEALTMVTQTLHGMRGGGVYDHVGKGYHRYATDAHWFLPHFEKMLYDQALMAMACLETYRATGESEFLKTTREIFEYVTRDMTSPEGVFFSAEDADSEGEEGKFYVWSNRETREILGEEDAEAFFKIHAFTEQGNFLDESTRRPTGDNIIHLPREKSKIAAELQLSLDELDAFLTRTYAALDAVRVKRIRPHLDDKVLTDWNGLMISAFARAARATGDGDYATIARKAADFFLQKMRTEDGRLLHRYRDGDAAIMGLLDDYAFFVQALLDLYEATFDANYLESARDLTRKSIDLFWDDENGGFFFTASDAEELIVRRKEIYDGAVPSGNSVALLNLLRLGRMTGETEFESKAAAMGKAFSQSVTGMPSAHCQFLMGLDFAFGPSLEIVISGPENEPATADLLGVAAQIYLPRSVVLLREGDDAKITSIAEYTKSQRPLDGKPAAYVCRNFACEAPVTEPDKVRELLKY